MKLRQTKDLRVQFSQKFRLKVKVECENDESLADLDEMDFIISQNISWVLKNALWLEKYLEIRKVDSNLKAQDLRRQ